MYRITQYVKMRKTGRKTFLNFVALLCALILCFGFGNIEPAKRCMPEHSFVYQQDGREETFYQVVDSTGMPLYYYRSINQYPCTSEKVCRIMALNMYWDIYGNFLKIELPTNERLTKVNHKDFDISDYKKLHKILNNPNSELQWCNYNVLTSEECENQYHVDAISGATNTDIEFEYINGAIKTTYALWKIANGEIKNTIINQSIAALDSHINDRQQFTSFETDKLNELWGEYTSGDRFTKVRILLLINNQDEIILTDEMSTMLFNYLKYCPDVYKVGILCILEKSNSINTSVIKEHLLSYLNDYSTQYYMAFYNTIQRTGYNRFIKKHDIAIWETD